MTIRQVALALGIPIATARLIEQRALEKVARALGFPPPRRPYWMRAILGRATVARAKQAYRCRLCHEEGHSRRHCPIENRLALQ